MCLLYIFVGVAHLYIKPTVALRSKRFDARYIYTSIYRWKPTTKFEIF